MDFFKKHWADFSFLVGLVIFVCFKIPDLSIAYFWDELGVYVPGALKMKDDGTIGLLPANLEPLYSRGHPLLFVFSQAAWFELFGDDVVTGHTFSLLLGVLTLIAFYWCSRNLAGSTVALVASITLAAQPVFYAGAGVILPEMMLALFTIPAVWAIIRQRWWWYALWGSMAMMTKESAIVIPALALLVLFAESIAAKDFFSRKRWKLFLIGLIPILVFALFLTIQRIQNGWFFFPLHVDLMNDVGTSLKYCFYISKDIYFGEGRYFSGVILVITLLYFIFKSKQNGISRKATVLTLLILIGTVFAACNFYMIRYILYFLPAVMFLSAWFVVRFAYKHKKPIFITTVISYTVVVVISCIVEMGDKRFRDTGDMSYKQVVLLKKEAITWLEKQPFRNEIIGANFPLFQAISDTRFGYVSSPIRYSENLKEKTCHAIWFYLNNQRLDINTQRPFKIIKEFQNSQATIIIMSFQDCIYDLSSD